MNSTSDHNLMMAVRDGDLDKLGHLFERYHKMLYNFFLRHIGDNKSSEDLVQDVFFRMLKYRHTYRGEGLFTTWMFSIARNAYITYFRKNRHQKKWVEYTENLESTEPNPEERVEQNSNIVLLQKALARLSDEKREVLLLSRFQNMKYEEIAKVTGCKVGTIKARVHWALKDLARIYQELTGE